MRIFKATFAVFVMFLLCSTAVHAQKSYTVEADMAFDYQSYHQAIELYKKAYTKEKKASVKKRILNNIGMSYYYMQDNKQAINWLDKAVKAGYKDDDAEFYLAEAQRKSGKLDEAISTYNSYMKDHPGSEEAEKGINSCKLAQEWMDNPKRWDVRPDPLLNSKQSDFAPSWGDRRNNALIFTSTREGSVGSDTDPVTGQSFSSLWYSEKDKKGKWMVPTPLGENINLEESNEGGSSLNSRSNEIYFTRCKFEKKDILGCKIYKSRKRGREWDVSEEVPLVKSDTVVVGHPILAFKDEVIIFASDQPGGKGGKDLWMATYDRREKAWINMTNLEGVNTAGDEMYPYVHEDGRLFFSSNGHPGMGSLDIFEAEKTGEREWGNVKNMQYPINSVNNDFGIIFNGKQQRGYLSTDREGGRGGDDIWSFRMPPLRYIIEGVVTDLQTSEPIPNATVKLEGTDGSSVEITTDEVGFYQFDQIEGTEDRYIKAATSYTISVNAENYLAAKGQETTVGIEKSTRFNKDFKLQPISDDPIEFPEVRYDLASDELQVNEEVNSKDSLDYLYETLVDNPTIVIELMAHTDTRGSDAANLDLSQRRAESCVDYLISKGIDAERMEAKGYGEKVPRELKNASGPFEKGAVITDEFINNLETEDLKKKAHQLNRRTEFRILRDNYVPKSQTEEGAPATETEE